MSTPARRRLMRDLKRIEEQPPESICAAPLEDNILQWNAVIFGPDDTPFEEGVFKLTMSFTEAYPASPPNIVFVSKMFHPNIYANGSICLDILQSRWSPTYDVIAILMSIQSLLHDPNISSPANGEAASLYQRNRDEYVRKVRETVEKSWIDKAV